MDQKTLKEIKEYSLAVYSLTKDKQHDFQHIKRVRDNALIIVKRLELEDKLDKRVLQSACYLHDLLMSMNEGNILSILYYHFLEERFNRRLFPKIIKKFNLPTKESEIITEAVVNSSYSIPYHILNKDKDLYSQILQDADSLDFISSQRLESLRQSKGRILFIIAKFFVDQVKKRVGFFLNFPQLASYPELLD